MKLSDFKKSGISKTVKFVNGKMEITESENLNGDIKFYEIDVDRLMKINEEITNNVAKDAEDAEFMFRVLPFLCDVEMDLTIEEFKTLLEKPSKSFAEFLDIIFEMVNEIFNLLKTLTTIKTRTEDAQKSFDNIIVKQESPQEELERLYEDLNTITDKEEKKATIKRIAELEKELEG
jgi:hypothetical protein